MHLLIDVGNTRIKWRLVDTEFNNDNQSYYGVLGDLAEFIKTLVTDEVQVILAAVNQTAELEKLLSSSRFQEVIIAHSRKSQGGVHNSYVHPERMGVDRWLAMIAAFNEIKKQARTASGAIVIDAGSALTIDIINMTGEHQGGYIVPGLLMAQQALFSNTERVIQYSEPSVQGIDKRYKALGHNTMQCVEYGALNQMLALIKQVKEEYNNYELFFTGGDGELLAGFLKTGTVDNDLVLKGLWQVRN